MPWFKVDDNLAFHRKVVAAGNAAMGLWVRAGAWSAQQLTDGFVPNHMVSVLGTTAQAKRLVTAGLWDQTEKGYQFHEWSTDDRQPTRKTVEAERRNNARRAALHRDAALVAEVRRRDRDRCRYCGRLVAWHDRRSAAGGTYDYLDPEGLICSETVVVVCRGCLVSNGNEAWTEKRSRLLAPGSLGPESTDAAGRPEAYLEPNQHEPKSDQDHFKTPARPDPTYKKELLATAAAAAETDPAFAEFWATYPRKIKKQDAIKAWGQVLRRHVDPQHVVAAAKAYADLWRAQGKQLEFIPYPASWLRGGAYDDEPDGRRDPWSVPDDQLTDDDVDEILGPGQPPEPPDEFAMWSREQRHAWNRDNARQWRTERRQRAIRVRAERRVTRLDDRRKGLG